MKRIIAVVLTVCLLTGYLLVGAEESSMTVNVGINMKTNGEMICQEAVVKVTTEPALSNARCTFLLVRPSTDDDGFVDVTDDNLNYIEKFAAAYQSFTDTEGVCTLTFPFDDVSGTYLLKVKMEDITDISEQELYIPSVSFLNNFVNQLKRKELNADEVKSLVLEKNKDIGIDATLYEQLPATAQQEIAQKVLNSLEEYTIEEFIACFDISVLLIGITSSASDTVKAALLSNYEDELKLTENPLYAEYDALGNARKKAVLDGFTGKDLDSVEEVRAKFFENLFIDELNNLSVYSQIGMLADKYDEELSFDSEFKALNALGKRRANLVYSNLMKDRNKIDSSAAFADYLKNAVENIEKLEKENIQNSSSGTSSSGSMGSTINMPSKTSPPFVSENDASNNNFRDLKEVAWAKEAIESLAKEGIVSGKEPFKFYPNDKITRSEFVKLIAEVFHYTDASADCSFDDVSKDHWAYPYIAGTAKVGIIQGISTELFGVENAITREEIATMIYRAVNRTGHNYNVQTLKNEFKDFDKVSAYAKNAVLMLYKLEMISGYEDNTFRPQENATRAETAVIIYNVKKLAVLEQ